MAKGQVSKSLMFKKILDTFEGAFPYNDGKEIRIPMYENDELVQIKVTLTAAKDNVNYGDDDAIPGAAATEIKTNSTVEHIEKKVTVPTAEEKANVSDLLKALGL